MKYADKLFSIMPRRKHGDVLYLKHLIIKKVYSITDVKQKDITISSRIANEAVLWEKVSFLPYFIASVFKMCISISNSTLRR